MAVVRRIIGFMFAITSIESYKIALPLREPFETSRRTALVSDSVIVELHTDAGVTGVGACTPVGYVTGETVDTVINAVERASRRFSGQTLTDTGAFALALRQELPHDNSARAGIEIALVDLLGRISGLPSYATMGGSPICVETDITIPIVDPQHAAQLAIGYASRGFRRFKVKVGTELALDTERMFAIHAAAPGSSFVIDANQGFDPDSALRFIAGIVDSGIAVDVFEQPADKMDWKGLSYVSQNSPVTVYADESAVSLDDVKLLVDGGIVGGINLKLMKLGFFGAIESARYCSEHGIPTLLGCMLEPAQGIAAALHVACVVGDVRYFDLDADMLLAGKPAGGFRREGSKLCPVDGTGLGIDY